MEKKPVLVVDMDNTLTAAAWRNQFAPPNGGTWEKYHRSCHADHATALVSIINQIAKNCDIIISTARPESVRIKTCSWLAANAEFIPLEVWMRSKANVNGMQGRVIKQFHRKNISENYNIIGCIDDDIAVCEDCALEGIPTIYVTKEEPIGKIVDWVVIWKSYKSAIALTPTPKPPVSAFSKSPTPKPPKPPMTDPADILKEMAEVFQERNVEYEQAYLQHGKTMARHFPFGIKLETEQDFFQYHCIVMDVVKTTRICNALKSGDIHRDSWIDKGVYAAIALGGGSAIMQSENRKSLRGSSGKINEGDK